MPTIAAPPSPLPHTSEAIPPRGHVNENEAFRCQAFYSQISLCEEPLAEKSDFLELLVIKVVVIVIMIVRHELPIILPINGVELLVSFSTFLPKFIPGINITSLGTLFCFLVRHVLFSTKIHWGGCGCGCGVL